SASRADDVRAVGRAGADAFRICGEGEPIPDAHEEAEGSGGADRSPVLEDERARKAPRTGVVSAAAGMEARPGSVPSLRRIAAAAMPPRDRISGADVVRPRRVRPDGATPGCAVPARHGRFSDRTRTRRSLRVR